MKKVIALMSIIGLLTFTNLNSVMAQDAKNANEAQTEQVATDSNAAATVDSNAAVAELPPSKRLPKTNLSTKC